MYQYDLVVIGTGPAGQKAAVAAAKLGKRVGIVERKEAVGGVCLHTGTIPSKALREAVLEITGRKSQAQLDRAQKKVTIDELIYWSDRVIRSEMEVIRHQMHRNGITLITGEARFQDLHTLNIVRSHGATVVTSENFIVAVGTHPVRSEHIPFDDVDIIDSDGLLRLSHLPKTMIIVGGGVIGTEYACILAALGVKITLVEGRDILLEFADREVIEALQYHMRQVGITLRLGEKVERVEIVESKTPTGNGNGASEPKPCSSGVVQATLESGKHLRAQTLMYCIGRQGATDRLGLDRVGIEPDSRGRIKVNRHYQTVSPNIYAVGDVVGFPALASTAMEQGRLAAYHMFGAATQSIPELFPYGIYSIPEISMVGKSEKDLTDEGIPYEVGIARYKEIARGQLLGDETGMLKLLVHEEARTILGVHIIGTHATELVHIGQTCMALGGTVDFFINNVFNYPTLAEAYKVAALNCANKLAYV